MPVFAETIVLKSGKSINVKIIERTDDYIKVDFHSVTLTYYFDEIASINGKHLDRAKQSEVYAQTEDSKELSKHTFEEVSKALVYIRESSLGTTGKAGAGTGFIIDSDGIIVTSCHVVSSSPFVQIQLYDGRIFPIESVIYYDINKDVCIFKIKATDLPFIRLADSSMVGIGDEIFAIGHPTGKRNVVSEGVVYNIRDLSVGYHFGLTAHITYGNSGGPILNSQGEVIGIAGLLIERPFALAINEIKPFIRKDDWLSWFEFTKEKPIQALAKYVLGNRSFRRGDIQEAIRFYEETLELYPEHLYTYYNLGRAYAEVRNADKVIEYTQAVLKRDQNSVEAYGNLGVAYCLKGDFEKALEYAEKAIELEPKSIAGYHAAGIIYHHMENFDKAIGYYQRILEINPKDVGTYNNLSFAYTLNGDFQRAIESAKKALTIDSESTAAYYYLALAHENLGNLNLAIENYNNILRIKPSDTEVIYFLGIAYNKKGNQSGALAQINKLKKLGKRDLVEKLRQVIK